jgi:hypothetical protein
MDRAVFIEVDGRYFLTPRNMQCKYLSVNFAAKDLPALNIKVGQACKISENTFGKSVYSISFLLFCENHLMALCVWILVNLSGGCRLLCIHVCLVVYPVLWSSDVKDQNC